MVCVVLGYAGSPSDDDLKFVKSSRALAFMKKQDGKPKVPLGTVFKGANPQVCAPPWVLHRVPVWHGNTFAWLRVVWHCRRLGRWCHDELGALVVVSCVALVYIRAVASERCS